MQTKSIKNILSLIRANSRNSRTFVLFVLFAVSCSKSPTDSRTGTLTGTVLLEGQTDHSGITVTLYKLAELDTTILRYNREYPNVGFPISQATEFDHRMGELVAESKTGVDGSFEIENIPQGEYNFVAQRQGFGWKYIYNLSINSNSITKLPNNTITLLGEAEVQGTITQNTTWQRDRHFIVTEDITVPQNTNLTIEPGAAVRFDGYYKTKSGRNFEQLRRAGEYDRVYV